MREFWKRSLRYPDILVSDLGGIWFPSKYNVPCSNGGTRNYITEPRYAPELHHKDYGNIRVYQLVCEAFNGPKPFEQAVCMHIDENRLNNRADNLRWGTQKENLNAPGFIAYCKSRTGENSSYTKGTRLRLSIA
jgi:hypothetical protein